MKIQKFLAMMLVAFIGVFSSCQYDDEELWDSVNDLAGRVSALEALTKQMNSDISAMQSVIAAWEKNVSITNVETLTDGYILHFSDGTQAVIKNGKDGADGKDGKDGKDGVNAPVIDVAQENGVYYWIITVDGETTWLLDEADNKLSVICKDDADGEDGKDGADGEDGKDGADGEDGKDGKDGADGKDGKNGITPILKIDSDGYWMVSYDNGTTYDYVLNSAGKKVNAVGPKGDKGETGDTGAMGPSGSTGSSGDSKFRSVVDNGDGTVTITLTTGTKFTFAKIASVQFKNGSTVLTSTQDIAINPDGTPLVLTYSFPKKLENASVEIVKNEGVDVTVDEANNELTFKQQSGKTGGKVVILFYNDHQTLTSVLTFASTVPASNLDEINDLLEAKKDLQDLSLNVANLSGNCDILLPEAQEGTTRTFVFNSVANGTVITIKEKDPSKFYKGIVYIEVPEGVTLPSLSVVVPEGTVYIKQGSKITKLNSTSANNTTIIGANAIVEELIVNKGNVRIEKDGKLNAIINSTTGIIYITNAGGTHPTTLPEKVIVIYEDTEHAVALNGKYSTDNFADLMSYNKDVLKANELSFTLSAGNYKEVIDVRGGKNITIQPKTVGQTVAIAGLDHQTNGPTPSTVVVKNITLDNTLQTEGWFTGTAQNIYPCVGAWGGNFTFEGCKFVVSGESNKETGVMTWWVTDLTTFKFKECEFVGYNDHASARAMQIYGNVNMEVTDCTFKTKKDYSLKYVADEGNIATFEGNKVYNSKYFVQLGSAPYAGNNYEAKINNTTLGEGVSHYYIDNYENQKVYIDGKRSVSNSEQLADAVSQGETNIMLADGDYEMNNVCQGKTFTINGSNKAVINVVPGGQSEAGGQLDYSLDGSTVTFNGVTIKTNSQLYAGFARLSAVYNDCVIQNTYNLGVGTSEFNRCKFNITNEYLRVGGATSAKFDGCTFNTDGRAILVYQDGTDVAQTVTVKDCTFNATAKANTWNGIHVAAVSIDGSQGGTYTVNLEGTNTVDSDFNGLWQIKAGETKVTVNE